MVVPRMLIVNQLGTVANVAKRVGQGSPTDPGGS